MSETSNEQEPAGTPETGLVADGDLPEELQPSEANPLAQQPEEQADGEGEEPKVDGMPDVGQPS